MVLGKKILNIGEIFCTNKLVSVSSISVYNDIEIQGMVVTRKYKML